MDKYELIIELRDTIADVKGQNSLGKLYTMLNKERNTIFHIDGEVVTPRIIETRVVTDC